MRYIANIFTGLKAPTDDMTNVTTLANIYYILYYIYYISYTYMTYNWSQKNCNTFSLMDFGTQLAFRVIGFYPWIYK